MGDKEIKKTSHSLDAQEGATDFDSFVLEKSIFSNVFEKDIRRIYIYKKAERIAKALILVLPAFKDMSALRERLAESALRLLDASLLPPVLSRDTMAKELLGLSSTISVVRSSGLLSRMNADIIGREAHALLEEVASYEEPRLSLPEAPTLASLMKNAARGERIGHETRERHDYPKKDAKRQKSAPSSVDRKDRRDAVLSVLRDRGPSYIKDISTVVRDVSEKTIQRELQALITEGIVSKEGNRRWTRYFFVKVGQA